MLLVLFLIREKIPVIMMGETGCGKTSLIIKLNQLLNDGETKIKKLDIHFETSNETIVSFIKEVKEYSEKNKNEDIWVFLDEINACNCLGLISELICKHSCNGETLPENMVFIAACNPFRKQEDKEKDGLKFENTENSSSYSNLVYKVNQLPDSLLNYVINFGSLSDQKDDEEKYIENIIKESIEKKYLEEKERSNNSTINKIISLFINWFSRGNDIIKRDIDINDLDKNKKAEYENLLKVAKNSVIEAHYFMRDNYGKSSVSLREIRRFTLLYEFFNNYLLIKKNSEEKNTNQIFAFISNIFYYKLDKYTDYKIYQYSIILSIYLVYYIKIKKKEEKKKFEEIMDKILRTEFNESFLEIPIREKEYIINNISLPENIAKNEDLLTNIFVLFVCINAKIPLFIVGKPGRSKSLSFELILKSMRGEDSDYALFKNLPKLKTYLYQGSPSSTALGIQNTFNKARLRIKPNENIISSVSIDELGIIEHLPNNPLKLMHSELEYDLHDENEKIAFVGISNYELDSSNMNRGIFLSIGEPDEEDLIKTSLTIAESVNKSLSFQYKDKINYLSRIYYKYINWLHNFHDKNKKDFHGARDFYNLIKIYVKNLSKKLDDSEKNLNVCIINSIERNLAGAKFDVESNLEPKTSLQKALSLYDNKNVSEVPEKYNFIDRIKENLEEIDNRYLLLFVNSPSQEYLIYTLLNKLFPKKEIINYIGSELVDDEISEEYIFKVINKIRIQIGRNVILILQNLESIYPSFYNLFNQNFRYVGKKKYTCISIGNSNNPFSFVNDFFKCVVIINEKRTIIEQPAFLNRFEKHNFDYEYLLNQEEIEISKNIMALRENFENENFKKDNNKLCYDINKLFINFNKEEIQGIIYHLKNNKKKSMEEIKDFIFQKISMVLSQDIILLINYSKYKMKEGYDKINK